MSNQETMELNSYLDKIVADKKLSKTERKRYDELCEIYNSEEKAAHNPQNLSCFV